MKLKIEQSTTEFYSPVAGLYFVGHAINKQTSLGKGLSWLCDLKDSAANGNNIANAEIGLIHASGNQVFPQSCQA